MPPAVAPPPVVQGVVRTVETQAPGMASLPSTASTASSVSETLASRPSPTPTPSLAPSSRLPAPPTPSPSSAQRSLEPSQEQSYPLSTPHTFTAPSLPPRKRGREEEELKENLTASFELSQKRQQVEVEWEVLRVTEVLKEVLIGEKEVQNEERKKVQRGERKRPAPPAPASQDKKLRRDDDNIFGFNDSPVKATPRLQAPARAEVKKVEEVEEMKEMEEMEEDMVGPSPQGAPLRQGWRMGEEDTFGFSPVKRQPAAASKDQHKPEASKAQALVTSPPPKQASFSSNSSKASLSSTETKVQGRGVVCQWWSPWPRAGRRKAPCSASSSSITSMTASAGWCTWSRASLAPPTISSPWLSRERRRPGWRRA